jgi:DNA-binding NtrC family response regulator
MEKIMVGVMNTSEEITEILQTALEEHGFKTQAMFTYEIKRKDKEFDVFVKKYKPKVIVYDIAIPYEENYKLFKRILKKQQSKNIRFVLTTTNKGALEKLVGNTKAIEIIGKPFDLNILISLVESAADIDNSSYDNVVSDL